MNERTIPFVKMKAALLGVLICPVDSIFKCSIVREDMGSSPSNWNKLESVDHKMMDVQPSPFMEDWKICIFFYGLLFF